MNENTGHTPQHHTSCKPAAAFTGSGVPFPPVEGPLVFARPPYGPLVETCALYGIKRSRAHEYAKSGLIDTFTMGRKRYVYLDSLDSLPERIAASTAGVAA